MKQITFIAALLTAVFACQAAGQNLNLKLHVHPDHPNAFFFDDGKRGGCGVAISEQYVLLPAHYAIITNFEPVVINGVVSARPIAMTDGMEADAVMGKVMGQTIKLVESMDTALYVFDRPVYKYQQQAINFSALTPGDMVSVKAFHVANHQLVVDRFESKVTTLYRGLALAQLPVVPNNSGAMVVKDGALVGLIMGQQQAMEDGVYISGAGIVMMHTLAPRLVYYVPKLRPWLSSEQKRALTLSAFSKKSFGAITPKPPELTSFASDRLWNRARTIALKRVAFYSQLVMRAQKTTSKFSGPFTEDSFDIPVEGKKEMLSLYIAPNGKRMVVREGRLDESEWGEKRSRPVPSEFTNEVKYIFNQHFQDRWSAPERCAEGYKIRFSKKNYSVSAFKNAHSNDILTWGCSIEGYIITTTMGDLLEIRFIITKCDRGSHVRFQGMLIKFEPRKIAGEEELVPVLTRQIQVAGSNFSMVSEWQYFDHRKPVTGDVRIVETDAPELGMPQVEAERPKLTPRRQ